MENPQLSVRSFITFPTKWYSLSDMQYSLQSDLFLLYSRSAVHMNMCNMDADTDELASMQLCVSFQVMLTYDVADLYHLVGMLQWKTTYPAWVNNCLISLQCAADGDNNISLKTCWLKQSKTCPRWQKHIFQNSERGVWAQTVHLDTARLDFISDWNNLLTLPVCHFHKINEIVTLLVPLYMRIWHDEGTKDDVHICCLHETMVH